MARVISVEAECFPIAGTFTIARGSKTQAEVITCTIREGDNAGRGECVPYGRYGETMQSVAAQIEAMREAVEAGMDRTALIDAMPAGAARNALDCALWDLEAKLGGMPVSAAIGARAPQPLETAYTLSLGEPDAMAEQAHANAKRPLLKVKLGGGEDDIPRIRAVRVAAPRSRIIIDANEGWSEDDIERNMQAAADFGISLIEQPLPAGRDGVLRSIARPVPVCADESVHVTRDLAMLAGLYDAINIKLDKTGGLTEAMAMADAAEALGLQVMVGCMVATSLAMAPAMLLAQRARYVDLDGPLLLATDRDHGLRYDGSTIYPPDAALWG